jgi:hypothetical protein
MQLQCCAWVERCSAFTRTYAHTICATRCKHSSCGVLGTGRSIPYLLCEWHDLQVRVDAPEAVLLQLGLDVLSHQVNGNNVITLLPGDDDVSKPADTIKQSVMGCYTRNIARLGSQQGLTGQSSNQSHIHLVGSLRQQIYPGAQTAPPDRPKGSPPGVWASADTTAGHQNNMHRWAGRWEQNSNRQHPVHRRVHGVMGPTLL